jgi:hypothetical protein
VKGRFPDVEQRVEATQEHLRKLQGGSVQAAKQFETVDIWQRACAHLKSILAGI